MTTLTTPPGTAAEVSAAGPSPARARRRTVPRGLRRLLGPVLFLVLWQLGSSTGLLDAQTLAGPSVVAKTGWHLVQDGTLGHHLWVSLRRAAAGLVLGVLAGLAVALVAGLFRLGEDVLDGTMQILRSIPILALTPLAILWFGIGEEVKIILVALGCAFPVYINTHAAIRGVDPRFVELARTLRIGRLGLVRRVVLPGALPGFFVGLRFSVTIAWLVLVVSEQINADSGIGFLMTQAREFSQTDVIVVGLAVYAVLGLVSNGLVSVVERRALRWRPSFEGS
ncbi:ABC transporter permease [Actinomadura gamaensis]|uniref:ABC transporter permease n=1 Tax=Actinomadura gamaensis TaxID=1763541 RepID=A0ABV9U2K1_9ACTN